MTMFELALLALLIFAFSIGVIIGSRINQSLVKKRLVRAEQQGFQRGLDQFALERNNFYADRSQYMKVISRLIQERDAHVS